MAARRTPVPFEEGRLALIAKHAIFSRGKMFLVVLPNLTIMLQRRVEGQYTILDDNQWRDDAFDFISYSKRSDISSDPNSQVRNFELQCIYMKDLMNVCEHCEGSLQYVPES